MAKPRLVKPKKGKLPKLVFLFFYPDREKPKHIICIDATNYGDAIIKAKALKLYRDEEYVAAEYGNVPKSLWDKSFTKAEIKEFWLNG